MDTSNKREPPSKRQFRSVQEKLRIVEEASELGAGRVLDRLGLGDKGAQQDIDELRELLGAWRAAKASAWKAAVEWIVGSLKR